MLQGVLSSIVVVLLFLALSAAAAGAAVLYGQKKRLAATLERDTEALAKREEQERFQNAMLPGRLLELFQEGTGAIRIGQEKTVRSAVLSFNMAGFSRMIRSRTPGEIVEFVNGVLEKAVPCVLFEEGEIEQYREAGFTALFLAEPERALHCAVSVCEAMGRTKDRFALGLSYGDVVLGMVGHERRCGALVISETTGLAEFLRELAERYGARILITGSLKKEIPDFESRYNSRYMGDIYLRAADAREELYDVYDGDRSAEKNGKRKTRLLFEEGVRLYQKGRLYDARLRFIEVLKANRMDGAAREYLYLCGQYLSGEKQGSAPSWLEVY